MDFIQGRTIKRGDLKVNDHLLNLIETIRCLHNSKQPFPKIRSPLDSFQLAIQKGDRLSTPCPTKFDKVKKHMEDIGQVLELHPVKHVPCHLDLNSQNILLEDNRFFIIDWENSAQSDPYFDLSMFAVFMRLDESEEAQFLTGYFGRPISQLQWDRYMIVKPTCLFLRAAIFLSGLSEGRTTEFYDDILKNGEIPPSNKMLLMHEEGRLNLPRWKIGLGLMEGAFELVESEKYIKSMERLKKRPQ